MSHKESNIYFFRPYELYGEFSQWYMSPFHIEGITYNCCEQYMMWSKAMLFGDSCNAKLILNEKNPYIQKCIGRKVKNFDDKVWIEKRMGIVRDANMAKFKQNKRLFDMLLSTKNEDIYEASPYDKIWGIGVNKKRAISEGKWKGINLLGISLMDVRNSLRNY